MLFRVTLTASKHGAPLFSTDDVIEADSGIEAESKAIAAWSTMRPDCSFRPLITTLEPDAAL
jgi:hypothetical protein